MSWGGRLEAEDVFLSLWYVGSGGCMVKIPTQETRAVMDRSGRRTLTGTMIYVCHTDHSDQESIDPEKHRSYRS